MYRLHGLAFHQMRMLHRFLYRQHRTARQPRLPQRGNRSFIAGHRLKPDLNSLDYSHAIFYSAGIIDKARITAQFRAPH